jgi:hypothetical protein
MNKQQYLIEIQVFDLFYKNMPYRSGYHTSGHDIFRVSGNLNKAGKLIFAKFFNSFFDQKYTYA